MSSKASTTKYTKRNLVFVLLLMAAVGVLIAWAWGPKRPPTPSSFGGNSMPVSISSETSHVPAPVVSKHSFDEQTTPSQQDALSPASSLDGVEIDGALRTDSDGNLVLNQQVRDFFDFFLSAADEIGPEMAISEIDRYITTYLPASAATQARALLGKYLQFKRFEFQQQSSPVGDADPLRVMRSVFEAQREQQNELFTPAERTALFGLETSYQEYTLATLELFADTEISDQQRAAQLQSLENALPSELRQSKVTSADQRQQQRAIEGLLAAELGDSELHASLIDQGVSQTKADEILEYRQQQQNFDERYQQYRLSKKTLDPSGDNYAVQLAQLQREYFPNPEQQTLVRLRDLNRE